MLQVTMDLQTELYQLEQRMMDLVKRRDAVITVAEHMIDNANREFDEIAVPTGRTINELRDRLKQERNPADRGVRRPAAQLDGLDDDDQQHYQELLAATRKRKR